MVPLAVTVNGEASVCGVRLVWVHVNSSASWEASVDGGACLPKKREVNRCRRRYITIFCYISTITVLWRGKVRGCVNYFERFGEQNTVMTPERYEGFRRKTQGSGENPLSPRRNYLSTVLYSTRQKSVEKLSPSALRSSGLRSASLGEGSGSEPLGTVFAFGCCAAFLGSSVKRLTTPSQGFHLTVLV